MKKILSFLFLAAFFVFTMGDAFAQKLDLEKTYKITGKSKRGTLANVEFDAASGNYTLTYVTKDTEKKAKFQIYVFDRDFNFIKMDEEVMEYEKAKLKFSWFTFRGDLYTVEGIYVQPNLIGTLVLKKKRITYKYDWFLLGYYKDIEILKKVKPKGNDGRKFFYYGHAEDDITGDVYILCGVKAALKGSEKEVFNLHEKRFVVLRYNSELELVGETKFEFEYPQKVVLTRRIDKFNAEDPANPGLAGMFFTFAPKKLGNAKGDLDPKNTNFTYVRVNEGPKLADRISFDSKKPYWVIDELIHDQNTDAIYMFGPSAEHKGKYYDQMTPPKKYTTVQLMKIANGKVEYLTETNVDEFEAKLQKPPSQKKAPAYKGKKFQIASYYIASNGDFFVVGQNFKKSNSGNQFNDVLGFHFDSKGVLKSQYSVDTRESNSYAKANGTPQFFIENPQQGNLYWFLQEIKDVYGKKQRLLSYPRVGKVELGAGKINDFQEYGRDSKKYLDPKFPYLQTDVGNTVVFFGSDKKGKELWFLRVILE